VPERFLASLGSGSLARLSFDALPGKEFSGRIVELGAVVDSLSRSLEVGIALDAPDARILAGMSATARLETASRQNVLLVPRTALIVSSQGSAVYIVKSDSTVERRGIETGLEGEAFIELKRGLVAGEILVTEGSSTLSEGDRVRIVADTAQAGGSR
jgi:membrane fusion protein (multidrug efflux system)